MYRIVHSQERLESYRIRGFSESGVPLPIVCHSSGRRRLGDASCSCPQMGKSYAMVDQRNLILSSLSSADFRLLDPYLEPADLPMRKVLEQRGKPIKAIYFPESGFASVVASHDSRPIE